MHRSAGFTLLEIMLVVAILSVVSVISISTYSAVQQKEGIDSTAATLVGKLRLAQVYSRSSYLNDGWSVRMDQASITLYKGQNYVSRDTQYDETVTIPGSVVVPSTSNLYFQKNTGQPTAAGTLLLTSGLKTKTVEVNTKGTVLY